jgi:hypothetical protein
MCLLQSGGMMKYMNCANLLEFTPVNRRTESVISVPERQLMPLISLHFGAVYSRRPALAGQQ